MKGIRRLYAALLAAAFASAVPGAAAQPTTQIATEYLMSYVAPLDPPAGIDGSLLIVGVRPGGWVKGPKVSGKFVGAGGDWLRIMPSGVLRLDVRGTIQTDDNALIYVNYNGIVQQTKEGSEKLNKGEVLTPKDVPYFVTAPTFQTSSEKYAWLNAVQAIAKMVEVRLGADGYIKYDVWVVR